MIAILIDFFLEKKSPIKLNFDKKKPLNSKYTTPAYDPLIQCVSILTNHINLNSFTDFTQQEEKVHNL